MFRASLVVLALLVGVQVNVAEEPQPIKLSDAEITKLMVGQWEDKARFGNISIHTRENFKADGVVEREDTINGSEKAYAKSSWEIKDGWLITVVIEGPVAKGTVIKGKVLAIDESSQQLEMEGGAELKKTRVKQ